MSPKRVGAFEEGKSFVPWLKFAFWFFTKLSVTWRFWLEATITCESMNFLLFCAKSLVEIQLLTLSSMVLFCAFFSKVEVSFGTRAFWIFYFWAPPLFAHLFSCFLGGFCWELSLMVFSFPLFSDLITLDFLTLGCENTSLGLWVVLRPADARLLLRTASASAWFFCKVADSFVYRRFSSTMWALALFTGKRTEAFF